MNIQVVGRIYHIPSNVLNMGIILQMRYILYRPETRQVRTVH